MVVRTTSMKSVLPFLLLVTGLVIDQSECSPVTTPVVTMNSTNHSDHEYNLATDVPSNHNCSIRPRDETIYKEIKQLLAAGAKVIEYTLSFNTSEKLFYDDVDSKMYRPFFWVRATGRHGTSLLALRPEYDKLSLYSLAIGVKEMNVALVEEPASCLNDLSYTEIELLIRELVMNDFKQFREHIDGVDDTTETVCNKHVIDKDGLADFQYYCCVRDEEGKEECTYLHSDVWLNLLLGVIILVKVLVVLYTPKFIPEWLYYRPTAVQNFVFRQKKKLKVMKSEQVNKYEVDRAIVFPVSNFDRMDNFKQTINEMHSDIPYSIELEELNLQVKHGRLLTSGSAPVGLFDSLADTFFRCKISERDSVNPCCKTNVFLCCKCCPSMSWRSFLRKLMKLLILVVLAMPWIARIVIYYEVESTEMEMQKEAAAQKSLDINFPGNTTLYLSPIHFIFLVIYAVLIFEISIFKLMGKRTQERFKLVLVKCFSDMRDTKQLDVIGWLVNLAVAPCTAYGVVGIIIGLVFWVLALPVVLVVVAFYTLPTVNISVRMLLHFMAYLLPDNICSMCSGIKKCRQKINEIETTLRGIMEEFPKNGPMKDKTISKSPRYKCEQLVSIIMCLAAFAAAIFLLMEFTAFIIEILVYVFMGVIVNADRMLTYLSLVFLMGVYAQDCFGFVKKKYQNFNESLNQFTLSRGLDQIKEEIYKDENQQTNLAIRIRNPESTADTDATETLILSKNMDGRPRWEVSKLCLFLDKKDVPCIPRGYFFKACTDMNYDKAPGQLVVNYLRAFAEMCVIIVFLLFVLIVVMAFGDTYELSAGNKMLATIAGGILPFLLRNLVFKSHDAPKISKDEADSILFQVAFNSFLKSFRQTWPLSDINVFNKTPLVQTTANGNSNTTNGYVSAHVIEESEVVPLVDGAVGITTNGSVSFYEDIDLLIDMSGVSTTEDTKESQQLNTVESMA